MIAELREDQLILSMRVAGLERAAVAPHLGALAHVRDALAALLLTTNSHRVHRAFLPEAPLAEYLRGAYAWTLAVAHALEKLALGLHTAQPDWRAFGDRIEAARNFHFDELEVEIRQDLDSLGWLPQCSTDSVVTTLAGAFGDLLDAARRLEAQLDEH